jgi:hypothetical protein
MGAPNPNAAGAGSGHAIDIGALLELIGKRADAVQTKVSGLQGKAGTGMDIPEMFEIQLMMNALSQASETATSMQSAGNQALMSIARNIK